MRDLPTRSVWRVTAPALRQICIRGLVFELRLDQARSALGWSDGNDHLHDADCFREGEFLRGVKFDENSIRSLSTLRGYNDFLRIEADSNPSRNRRSLGGADEEF